MSSSQRADRRRVRSRRPWSLRRRLIVQLAALLALVCLVVGVVTEFALREFLIDQPDNRLLATSAPGNSPPQQGRPGNGRVPPAARAAGQGVDSLFLDVTPD